MTDGKSTQTGEKTAGWRSDDETVDEEKGNVVPLTEKAEIDLTDWEAMSEEPSPLDDYASEEYTRSTTQEYEGLAEEISRASQESWEQQAVAASLSGVNAGLVSFDDMTGARTMTEEEVEASEQAAASDFTLRLGTAVVLLGLFLGSLILGGPWFSVFVALLMFLSVGELYATLRTAGYKPLALFGLLGVVLMAVGAHMSGPAAIAGWVALVTVAVILFYTLVGRSIPLENASVTLSGMAWVGLLAFAILLASGPSPVAYVLFVVILVAVNDITAYFVGRSFGRHPLAPRISPQKTVEGMVGGFVATLMVASILATFPAWEVIGLGRSLVAAAVVGLITPFGDAVESMVKRSVGVKDMGSVLPGHGGMLDRIDGFLFAVPALYFLFRGYGLL